MKILKKLLSLLLTFFISLNVVCIAVEETSTNYLTVTSRGNILISDLVNFQKNYERDGSVILVGSDLPVIDENKTHKLAEQQAKEVKKYFLYWLDYWNIKFKFVDISTFINSDPS